MYSILMSKFSEGFSQIKNELAKMINANAHVVIIPWSFAVEIETKNINDFFNGIRKDNYLNALFELGVKNNNIKVLDCYNDSKEYMIESIKKSNVLVLIGGNPEMLYRKVCESGILETLKNYNGVIIGSSAGAEVQLKKYFITKKNNYYKKFEWYDGFGIIDNDFYFDVHSINKGRYLPSLKEKSKETKKDIYCLFDTGSIIYNRSTKKIDCYGDFVRFEGK